MRILASLVAYIIASTTSSADIHFSVVPSQKAPYIRTLGGGYRLSDDHSPDPQEVALRITAEGAQRFHRAVWTIEIDSDALPKGVYWFESQGRPDQKYHYFQITRSKPFRLRREDFRGLPDWLRLPKLILKRRETPNQAMERTSGSFGSLFSMNFHPQLAATRSPASRRSSCSR